MAPTIAASEADPKEDHSTTEQHLPTIAASEADPKENKRTTEHRKKSKPPPSTAYPIHNPISSAIRSISLP
jgi:hypothetical protein